MLSLLHSIDIGAQCSQRRLEALLVGGECSGDCTKLTCAEIYERGLWGTTWQTGDRVCLDENRQNVHFCQTLCFEGD